MIRIRQYANAKVSDLLLADDVEEMRSLANEWAYSEGPVGDLARYLLRTIEDRAQCLRVMAMAKHDSGRRAIVAAERRAKERVDTEPYARLRSHRPTHPEIRIRTVKLRPMPRPITEEEVEAV